MASLKLDSVRLDQAAEQSSSNTGASSAVDPAHVDKFDSALQGKNDNEQEGGKEEDRKQSDSEKDTDASGKDIPSASALLSSLFGKTMDGSAPVQAAATAQGSLSDIGALVDTLVDRILVSQPGDKQEVVRIQLSDGVLRNTEVSLTRGAEGSLSVQLATNDLASIRLLSEAQPALQKQLEAYGPVQVSIKTGTDSSNGQSQGRGGFAEQGQGDNNTEKRSQGYVSYDPNSGK